jgi:RNase P subunit RPR2
MAMPTKYKIAKARKVKQKSNILVKPKIEITDEVTCAKCKKPSGWTNDILRYVSGERELKCKQCDEVCIRVVGKKYSDDIIVGDGRTPIAKRWA